MDDFLKQLKQTIESRELLCTNEQILVALSGGADSVSLLYGLKKLSYSVSAAHLHHGLRGEEADEDEAFVRSLCESLQVPLYVRHADIRSLATQTGQGLEETGRQERYRFFEELLFEHGFDKIVTAHNADDQAETILMHFLRGSGVAGLAGIPIQNGRVVRPMLTISRHTIEAFLTKEEISYREDSTNRDTAFTRNRIRHELLPFLEANFNPSIRHTLQEYSDYYSSCSEFFDLHAKNLWNSSKRAETFGVSLDRETLLCAHTFLATSAIHSGLKELSSGQEISYSVVTSVYELVKKGRGRVSITGALEAEACYDRIYFYSHREMMDFSYQLPIEGEVFLPELGRTISAFFVDQIPKKVSNNEMYLNCDTLKGQPIFIRNRKPGDFFYPTGMNGKKKLQDFFVDKKIPRFQRDFVPILSTEEDLLWVVGYRTDRRFADLKNADKILHITFT